jgi:undecaprenyl-diphosphatase
MQRLLGITQEEIALGVVLHLGTALALMVFFYRDILRLFVDKKLFFLVATATMITGIIGITGKDFFEGLFSEFKLVSLAWIITGIILILTKGCLNAKRNTLNLKDAFIFGISQALAIIPGISRSGITISTLLFRGIEKENAFRFSFLASIPVVCGAALLELKKIDFALRGSPVNFGLGFIFSFFAGLFSLRVLKSVLLRAKFHYFGYYCIIVAILTLVFLR